MKIILDLDEYDSEKIERYVKNYNAIKEAKSAVDKINELGMWLYQLQDNKIHEDKANIRGILDNQLGFIIDELQQMGGNYFVNKVI